MILTTTPQAPPIALPPLPFTYPKRSRRKGRKLQWPEEKPGQRLFVKDDYSFLCKGGNC